MRKRGGGGPPAGLPDGRDHGHFPDNYFIHMLIKIQCAVVLGAIIIIHIIIHIMQIIILYIF